MPLSRLGWPVGPVEGEVLLDRRYQIFVSSTFRDLQAERKAALDAILELGHFPAGMEMFPATNQTAWDLIERVIGDCDYYVLIIGGRYGSTDADGIGYTEKEYDLATKLGIPVLPLLHIDPSIIPSGNSEMEPKARKKLDRFRKKVEKHHCKYWRDSSQLKTEIVLSLSYAFRVNPRIGWARADGIDSPELLKQLNEVRIRLDRQLAESAALKLQLESSVDIKARLDQPLNLSQEELAQYYNLTDLCPPGHRRVKSLAIEWRPLILAIGESGLVPIEEATIRSKINNHLTKVAALALNCQVSELRALNNQHLLGKIITTLLSWDLIEPVEIEMTYKGPGDFWGDTKSESVETYKVLGWVFTRAGKVLFGTLVLNDAGR